MAEGMGKILLPEFTGTNFGTWLFRLNCILEEKGCIEAIQDLKEEDKKSKEFLKKDSKARSLIVCTLADKYLEYVRNASSALEMIEKLRKIFERKSTLSSLYLRKQILTLKCGQNEELCEHFNKFDSMIRQLEETGSKLSEQDKVCHLLLSMDDQYTQTITALETTNVELTIDYIKSKLLDAELKKQQVESQPSTSESYGFEGSTIKCYKCGKPNHYARNCPNKASSSHNYRGQGNNRGRGNNQSRGNFRGRRFNRGNYNAYIGEQSEQQIMFIAAQAHNATSNECKIEFVIDSGASYNMINEKYEKYMTDIEEIPEINIIVANGGIIPTKKKGTFIGMSYEGVKVTIECLIMKNLTHNLLSVLKMNKKGIEVIFSKNIAQIVYNDSIITGKSNGKLYTVTFDLKPEGALLTKTDTNLWHRRMGHLNYGGMKILGLPLSKDRCSICMEAKGARNSFTSVPKPRTSRIGELIYCDIGGPITPISKDGERFYLTIIDDYSHFMELYLLKGKDEAKYNIIKYINRMKNNGNNVLRVRTDQGREFLNKELKSFYENNGIKQETTCVYTPQQNSVCERMNRTLLEKTK